MFLESGIQEVMGFEPKTFQERLIERRQAKQLSQEDLARLVGSSGRSIYNYEHSASDLACNKLCKLARALDTDPNYLLGWDEQGDSND